MKINSQNYETYFLSYIDNELSDAEKKEVVVFIQENPKYANDLALLQQAVLEPTTIEFEDKVLLYRYQEMEASLPKSFKENLYKKEAPVVKGYFTNVRMRALTAVAALLLVFIGYQFATKQTELTINSASNSTSTSGIQITPTHQNNSSTSIKNSNTISAPSASGVNSTLALNIKEESNFLPITKVSNEPISQIAEKPLLQDLSINELKSEKYLTTIENVESTVGSQITYEQVVVKESLATTNPEETFDNINTDNPDRVIYVANLEIDGDKLRGLTRRVSALLRRNKTEKEK